MEEQTESASVRRKSERGTARKGQTHPPYPFELRLKAVKLHLEEGFSLRAVCEELGLNTKTLWDWVKRYRESGDEGLRSRLGSDGSGKPKIPQAVKQKIVAIKTEHPGFGVKRIAQVLQRVFFLRASRETVRRTLHRQNLVSSPTQVRRSPPKPRFFERSTPNQMWQSDIFTFHLGGKNAYVIGFMDDYSRYLVGCDLFRSQSAENVLEVYRRAVGEFGVPKEVLTDQGRQYTNWRGKTRFELELQKDRVHHIKSRAHHPMTLGKIERFWKTIWEDFLVRAKFESFESGRERVRLWVKHYNHQRPHQGIGGLCPADRFFAIDKELRAVMEQGIQDNLEELALRGEPKEPFYMVGRMGDEAVVIRAEAGKLRVDIDKSGKNPQIQDNPGGQDELPREQEQKTVDSTQRGGEVPGGVVGVERAQKSDSGLQGLGDSCHAADSLAGAGAGGDAGGLGAQGPQWSGAAGACAEAPEASFAASGQAGGQDSQAARAFGEDSATGKSTSQAKLTERAADEQPGADPGTVESRIDSGSPQRSDQCQGGGGQARGIAQDLLQVGKAGAGGDGGGVERSSEREAAGTQRARETDGTRQ
jgi:transposase InsO family protein